MQPHATRHNHRDRSRTRPLLPAILAVSLLLGPPLFSGLQPGSCLAAEQLRVHDAPLDEAVDFYQFTDEEGVVHFVDAPEKIPRRYQQRVIVRKELPSSRQVTRVVVVDNQVHLPVTITHGGSSVQGVFTLDTGASITSITEALAARLNIKETDSRPATTRLADGSEVAIRLVRVDSVKVGFREKAPLEIGILQHHGTPPLHDGLLGLDFLKEFQYQLDLSQGMIRWQ